MPSQFCKKIEDLKADGCEKFVIDVRYNPGGDLLSIKAVLARFLNEGDVVIRTIYKDQQETQAVIAPTGSGKDFFEGEFVPITEEPIAPEREREDTPVTSALPEFTPAPTETPEAEAPVIDPDTMSLYIVQSGDTLAGICQEFYGNLARMEEVKGLNQIPDENWIYAGQELYLP